MALLPQGEVSRASALVPYRGAADGELSVTRAHFCPLCRRPFLYQQSTAGDTEEADTGAGAPRSPQQRPRHARHSQVPTSRMLEYFRSLPGSTAGPINFDHVLESAPSGAGTTPGVPEESFDETTTYYARYFVELAKLGQGAFGGVFVCRHVVDEQSLGIFAVKKVPIGASIGSDYVKKALTEVKVLESLRHHPNVVEYHHSWVDTARLSDFGPPVRCLFILMEYCSLGSLSEFAVRSGHCLSNDAVWWFILQGLHGLRHVHDRGLLHRDIKPDNFLLTDADDPDGPPRLVLSDFGTAGPVIAVDMLDPDEVGSAARLRTGGTGTEEWMAPEVLACSVAPGDIEPTYRGLHTTAADMWGMGCVLHFLCFGGTLPAVTPQPDGFPSVMLRLASAPIPRPREMIDLCTALLHPNPACRIQRCGDVLDQPRVVSLALRLKAMSWRDMALVVRPAAATAEELRTTSPPPPTRTRRPPPLLEAARAASQRDVVRGSTPVVVVGTTFPNGTIDSETVVSAPPTLDDRDEVAEALRSMIRLCRAANVPIPSSEVIERVWNEVKHE